MAARVSFSILFFRNNITSVDGQLLCSFDKFSVECNQYRVQYHRPKWDNYKTAILLNNIKAILKSHLVWKIKLINSIVLIKYYYESFQSIFYTFRVHISLFWVWDVLHLQYCEKSSVYRVSSQETNKSHCFISTKIQLIVFGRGNSSKRVAGL